MLYIRNYQICMMQISSAELFKKLLRFYWWSLYKHKRITIPHVTKETDFLIVGSGVAGTVLAKELLASGLGRVAMLEAGSNVIMQDHPTWQNYVITDELPYTKNEDKPDDVVSLNSDLGLVGSRLFAKGGSSLHWGGWAFRFKPEDFHLKTNTGIGCDWLIDYNLLEQYYCKAEHFLQVAGNAEDTSISLRRSLDYPFRCPEYGLPDKQMIKAFEGLNISYGHVPISRNSNSINGKSACMTTGTCKYCPVGARYSCDQTLDSFKDNLSFELTLDAPVINILMDKREHCIGVTYKDIKTNTENVYYAKHVFICAGAIETPKLLLASKNNHWQNGIGNDTKQVGHYLIAHPFFEVSGFSNSNQQLLSQEIHFALLCSRHYDSEAEQKTGKLLLLKSPLQPKIEIEKLMGEGKSVDEILNKLKTTLQYNIYGMMEEFPEYNNFIEVGMGINDFGLPKTKIHFQHSYNQASATRHMGTMEKILLSMGLDVKFKLKRPRRADHAMSTCRMSQSPVDGVVDSNLRVHETENLYICSNAVFPSGAAVNPTLTLAALAFRLSNDIISAYKS